MEGLWIFPLLGVVAGVLAGLLGIGGGVVLVPALAWVLPWFGVPKEAALHAALATSLASIVATSASSALSHHRRGSVMWPTVAWMAPGLLLGGWLGSAFAVGVDDGVLRWFVAIYCFVVAMQLLLSKNGNGGPDAPVPAPRGWPIGAAGVGIGAVSSVVGIGGGSMTVPLLVWRGVAPVRAVGTSSACGVAIGVASALGYALHAPPGALPEHAVGYVHVPATIGIAVASIVAAPWGTKIAHRIGAVALKRVFALFLLAVAALIAFGG